MEWRWCVSLCKCPGECNHISVGISFQHRHTLRFSGCASIYQVAERWPCSSSGSAAMIRGPTCPLAASAASARCSLRDGRTRTVGIQLHPSLMRRRQRQLAPLWTLSGGDCKEGPVCFSVQAPCWMVAILFTSLVPSAVTASNKLTLTGRICENNVG